MKVQDRLHRRLNEIFYWTSNKVQAALDKGRGCQVSMPDSDSRITKLGSPQVFLTLHFIFTIAGGFETHLAWFFVALPVRCRRVIRPFCAYVGGFLARVLHLLEQLAPLPELRTTMRPQQLDELRKAYARLERRVMLAEALAEALLACEKLMAMQTEGEEEEIPRASVTEEALRSLLAVLKTKEVPTRVRADRDPFKRLNIPQHDWNGILVPYRQDGTIWTSEVSRWRHATDRTDPPL
ncbi:hypothetical protein OC845_006590 [Tilletia horrida]|nr:hypothetical protein OC845_006590 [Tilletia horrida]